MWCGPIGEERVHADISARGVRCLGGTTAAVRVRVGSLWAAHHWARWLTSHGHTPQLMAAEFVKPFRKSRAAKNDCNDGEAVLTAVRQPNMRFVAVKSIEQQAYLSWHRMGQGWSEERTALINRLRGLLGEFGVWRGRSAAVLRRALPVLEHDEALPLMVRRLLTEARPHLARLDEAIAGCEVEIKTTSKRTQWQNGSPRSAVWVLSPRRRCSPPSPMRATSRMGASSPRGRG
jgi:transposase